ncbi:tRNA 2-selenouridine(34) synthase MnmH [Senegalia massiliensis]|uniref:tRNA 2-selenouridine(34) synthase MnmH n=1 Tax=Senegalia massiliensis TaxID=1720316 RepID=A0A845QZK9_9CLOT|nr:tRNA 2-selenouridine(34) synthase MnmH [Senegalia massiliensis]NBI07915.1 tRNA 2-selenouridine(34) synthase MnmH [Senegalia massiliensis]
MIKRINYKDIKNDNNIVYIDVRSPKEYEEDTIPNSINIPILNNKEREEIGYIYTQVNKDKARRLGLKYASKKLINYYDEINKIIDLNKKAVLFCYRGGMRSSSIAKVLDVLSMPIYVIDGGYKEYRNYVINNLNSYDKKFKFIVLHGYTGVGKTEALKTLELKGHEVLDLENIAQNSGSVFGNIFYKNKSSNQKKFESLLLNKFLNFKDTFIFVESESKRIGNSIMPDFLYNNIQNGYHILIQTNLNNRIKTIENDYLNNKKNNKDLVVKAIRNLKKRLGKKTTLELEKQFINGNYKYVIKELMLNYYDPLYNHSINKITEYDMVINYDDINELTKELIDFKSKLKER